MINTLPASLCAAILDQSHQLGQWQPGAQAAPRHRFEGRHGQQHAAAAPHGIGQSLDVMIPERLRAAHWAGYRAAMATGGTRHSGKPMLTKSLHRSGTAVYVEMSFAVVTDANLQSMGSVAIARAPRDAKTPGS